MAQAVPPRDADDETERLIAELRARGIAYLSGGHDPQVATQVAASPLPPAELLLRLAGSQESRVRNAFIALLLLHPDLAEVVPEALTQADPATAEQIVVLALAALYLSHLWSTRLALALGFRPVLPKEQWARFWHERGLPAPTEFHGELGLRALQEAERHRRGLPLNFMGDWQNQVDRLLAQGWASRRRDAVSAGEHRSSPAPMQREGQADAHKDAPEGEVEQRLTPAK